MGLAGRPSRRAGAPQAVEAGRSQAAGLPGARHGPGGRSAGKVIFRTAAGRMGLTFEEFRPGMKVRSHSVTVTEAHVAAFAWLTGDWNPLHMDAEYAGSTIFGGRIAHGMLTASLALGLFAPYLYGTAIALLEVGARFLKPVRIGDTIYVETEVLDRKPSEKYRGGGVVRLRHEVRNQNNEVVAVVETKALVGGGRWPAST